MAARNTFLFGIALFVAFAALEGLTGSLFFGRDLVRAVVAEAGLQSQRLYLEPDTLTGWRPIPSHEIRDLWGPGRDFITNDQGFRNSEHIGASVASGTMRIVCSGDSYTMGLGVGNGDTWCAQLASGPDRIEAVNLGAAGYGVDQAYLRYLRDGAGLDHQIHVFAMIGDDFRRMRSNRFVGYEKPLFQLESDSLVLTNVPVPRTSMFRVWMIANRARLLNPLHLNRAGSGLLRALLREPSSNGPSRQQVERTAGLILQHVIDISRGRGVTPVLVYLPVSTPNPLGRDWIGIVDSLSTAHEVPFVDVATPAHRERRATRDSWFRSDNHYTEAGNAFVASLLAPVVDSILQSGSRLFDRAPTNP